MDGEAGYEDHGQCRGEGQRQPRREQAREDSDECGAEHEGELVRGALIGKGGVQVRGVPGRTGSGAGRPGGQCHPADAGQRTDLRAAHPGHEGRGQHGHRGGKVVDPGDEVGREDQGNDGHGVGDGGYEQDAALAEPVCEDAEDGGTECGTDADGAGRGAAHGVRACDGGDECQGADRQHGKRQAGEEPEGDEAAAGEQRQLRVAAAICGPRGRQSVGRN
ncbi:hypothetical protein SRABI128_06080 [Microbacterium sp. Bi128]|nr:hypothetical protein SRABI128_06080 [Microbacterium sp. Bi128]